MITFKEFLLESRSGEHHASVIPLMGLSPISHMGHALDLGDALSKLPGARHVGISTKADVYTPGERSEILNRQWQQPNLSIHPVKSGGDTIARAYSALPPTGKKHLHILVGADRVEFANGLKKSLEDGKIKEMGDSRWDSITVHTPEDLAREHGMSGTKMRTAVANNDFETFHRHLGPMFSVEEAREHFNKIKTALDSGQIKVKR